MRAKRPPNIVLFMPETLRADVLFKAPYRPQTPHLDQFRAEATTFTNCFSQHTVCTPSRCSMFTGLYPHVHGHRTLAHLLHAHERNLFRDLKEAGYHTVCFGKNDLLAEESVSLSFDRVNLPIKKAQEHMANPWPQGHRLEKSFLYGKRPGTEWKDFDWACIESAVQFLGQKHEKPFCLFLPLEFVHPPYEVEEPWFSLHDRSKLPEPVPYCGNEKRRYARMIHEAYGLNGLTTDEFREIKGIYYGMISRMDDLFGRIVRTLYDTRLYDETALCFFSDHGDYTGDYGLTEKWWTGFEDCIINVPLVIKAPGKKPEGACNRLVEMTDLYATVLDIAGIKPKNRTFSRSLFSSALRNAVFAEAGHLPDEAHCREPLISSGIYREKTHLPAKDPAVFAKTLMVRTNQYKYIYCPGEHHELYDLLNDPRETRNCAHDNAHASTCEDMREMLLHWLLDTVDTVPITWDKRTF